MFRSTDTNVQPWCREERCFESAVLPSTALNGGVPSWNFTSRTAVKVVAMLAKCLGPWTTRHWQFSSSKTPSSRSSALLLFRTKCLQHLICVANTHAWEASVLSVSHCPEGWKTKIVPFGMFQYRLTWLTLCVPVFTRDGWPSYRDLLAFFFYMSFFLSSAAQTVFLPDQNIREIPPRFVGIRSWNKDFWFDHGYDVLPEKKALGLRNSVAELLKTTGKAGGCGEVISHVLQVRSNNCKVSRCICSWCRP